MSNIIKILFFPLVFVLIFAGQQLQKRAQKEPVLLVSAAISSKYPINAMARAYVTNYFKGNWNELEINGETALNILVSGCQKWTTSCAETAEIMLGQGADINLTSSGTGMAPLHAAVFTNNVQAAKFLLEHGADGKKPVASGQAKGLAPIEFGLNMDKAPKETIDYLKANLPSATPAVLSPQI